MSNKPHNAKTGKTKITKISANTNHKADKRPSEKAPVAKSPAEKATASPKKPTITVKSINKRSSKKSKGTDEKPLKEVFIMARPFVAFGRYLRDSWHELRQVRWPNRKNTWKMTFAVLIYCAIFVVFIILLDTFFTFIFNLLLTK